MNDNYDGPEHVSIIHPIKSREIWWGGGDLKILSKLIIIIIKIRVKNIAEINIAAFSRDRVFKPPLINRRKIWRY